MLNKNIYYLAIQYYGVIPKIRNSEIPFETLLDSWIEEYGLDLIGVFEDKQEATAAYEFNQIIFGQDGFKDEVQINYLEKCLSLKL